MEIYTKSNTDLCHMVLASGVSVAVGDALKVGSGGLVKCAVTDKPMFISNTAATGDGILTIPVREITCDAVLAAPLGAAASGLTAGTKVKLHTDINSLTGTAGGCCLVLSFDGKAAGDRVLFKVVEPDPT